VDDVINVSGHRIGTAEVESALVAHPKVAEAAVVPYPHDIKGQAIYAFVTLVAGEEGDEGLQKQLNQTVRKEIGALAAPEKIQFTPALPKTRSGKIMRRILRKIAEGASQGFGDISTLADPTIVDALVTGRQ
jgi:acetyl-CoA synthetase